MARCKAVPKRRRIEDEKQQKAAIEALKNLPEDIFEAAAADAIRADVSKGKWECLDDATQPTQQGQENIIIESPSLPSQNPFSGLGRYTFSDTPEKGFSSSDFSLFQILHDQIKEQASTTSWSGSTSDPRRRAYGFLPNTIGYDEAVRSKYLDISQPNSSSSEAAAERNRNAKAMVVLDVNSVDDKLEGAMERLLSHLRSVVQPPEFRRYLQYSQLVAAQPNLHCGRHLLPSHVDDPTKDGFGIVIVTISIRGSATIMLDTVNQHSDSAVQQKPRRAVFFLPHRGCYMLSGNARNMCRHGVLANEDSGQRESLNLRFGLHGLVEGTDPPARDVLKYWKLYE